MSYDDGETVRVAFTSNISVGGAYISANKIPEADRVRMTFEVPNVGEVEMEADVIRGEKIPVRLAQTMRGGFAVCFDRLTVPEAWYNYAFALQAEAEKTNE